MRAAAPVGRRRRRAAAAVLLALVSAPADGQQDDPQADLRAVADRITAAGGRVAAAPAAVAAEAEEGAAQPLGDGNALLEADAITLNFQDADIRALINTVSQVTGRNFVVDPRVKGRVTVVSGGHLDVGALYDVFLSVLEVHGFSAVDSGSLVKIVPSNVVKQYPTRTYFGSEAPHGDRQVTQVYQLEHGSVQELTPIIRPLLPPTSHFAADPGSNTLVFTDTAANVHRILEIARMLDIPDDRSGIHVVFVRHANVGRLAQTLSQLAASMASRAAAGGRAVPVTVQADEAASALIIHAPDSQFQVLRALIDELDVERPEQGNIHVLYLRFAQATDLVPILNEMWPGTGAEQQGQPGGVPVSVQADEDTNALVIKAAADDFDDLKAVVEQLDVRRNQVFVETIIAEVSTNKAADIGIEWQGLYRKSSGGEVAIGTGFSPSSGGGINVGVINRFVTDLSGAVVPDLDIVLRALRSDDSTNILSTPNLLTLDNETAEIVVGQEVPFITGQFVSDATTTRTDREAGGETTNVVNPFQTIERKDVGLTLRITPQINEGDAIRLEIEQEISSVSPTTVQGAADLITNTRSITATVLADDGQIIVLGGLITDDVQDTVEWVPLLGRIPLLGALFRKKTKSAVERNLMVFLRPKIIRSPDDIRFHTRRLYEAVRMQESESLPDSRRMIRDAEPPVLPPWQERRSGR